MMTMLTLIDDNTQRITSPGAHTVNRDNMQDELENRRAETKLAAASRSGKRPHAHPEQGREVSELGK